MSNFAPSTMGIAPSRSKFSDKKGITPAQARAEMAQRELARRHYADFRRYMAPWYEDAAHNLYTAEKLEQVELFIRSNGKEGIGRLIICKPPQYGKSLDAARLFVAWVLGRNPDKRVAITSYAASLSDGHSGAVRDYVQSQRFQNIFGVTSTVDAPVEVSDDSASKSDWDLGEPHRGGCVSRGIGGGLSGKGADLLVIDDPTKDAEEGRSVIHQHKVKDWFESVAYQRMSQGGAIVIIQTRWNPDDLVGQLLKKMGSDEPGAEKWEVVFEPALALEEDEYPKNEIEFHENLLRGVFIPIGGDQLGRKPGEPLWPWKYSREYVEKKKANTSPYIFSSLDQQLPRAYSGGVFDEPDIRIIEASEIPPNQRWCSYIDLALGNSKQSDLNATMPIGLFPNGDIVGRDLIHERELDKFLKRIKQAMVQPENMNVVWGVEATAFQTLVFQQFIKDSELAHIKIVKVIPQESKMDRAATVSLRAKEKHFCLVRGQWNQAAIREMLDFPYGQHDDIVDAISGGQYMIAKYGQQRESKIL